MLLLRHCLRLLLLLLWLLLLQKMRSPVVLDAHLLHHCKVLRVLVIHVTGNITCTSSRSTGGSSSGVSSSTSATGVNCVNSRALLGSHK